MIGSVAVLVTSWHCKLFRSRPWQCYFWIATILISVSTVFLKQHSVLDLPPAILLCALAYPLAFHSDKIFHRRRRARGAASAGVAAVTSDTVLTKTDSPNMDAVSENQKFPAVSVGEETEKKSEELLKQ